MLCQVPISVEYQRNGFLEMGLMVVPQRKAALADMKVAMI